MYIVNDIFVTIDYRNTSCQILTLYYYRITPYVVVVEVSIRRYDIEVSQVAIMILG